METLEQLYKLEKHEVELDREQTTSGRWLESFMAPGEGPLVDVEFPEFTCLCPRTSQPDFATITIRYIPDRICVELKSLKYYLNSFRNEGHFHEEVVCLIYNDLWNFLLPMKLQVVGEFNVRGGTYPTITVGEM